MLAALATSAFHPDALAVATSQASASNFRYVLTDLNPSDRITPTLWWGQSPDYGKPYLEGFYGSDFVLFSIPRDNSPLQEEWRDGDNAISAGIQGAMALATTSLTSAVTSAGSEHFGFDISGRTKSTLAAFVLAPRSRVSFLVDYTVSGSITDSIDELSLAVAEVWSYGVLYGTNGSEIGYDFSNAYNSNTSGNIESGTLTVTLSNTTASYLNGTMNFATSNYARSIVSPVPEPMTYAMLLGGLAIVAAMRKRA